LTEASFIVSRVIRTINHAKQFFQAAARRRLIAERPFADLKPGSKANERRKFFVARDTTSKLLMACPAHEWRLIMALARYGGLRTPSETLRVEWPATITFRSATSTCGALQRPLRQIAARRAASRTAFQLARVLAAKCETVRTVRWCAILETTPGWIRTSNLRFRRRRQRRRIANGTNDFRRQAGLSCSPVAHRGRNCPDLARVIVAWPDLSDNIRSAVLAPIGTTR
jgi:hypothetical protein